MTEDTVNPIAEELEPAPATDSPEAESHEDQPQDEPVEDTQVPLSALQKERRKRQEIEMENRWLKEQQMRKPQPEPEPDDSRYETATREDLSKAEFQILRKVEERSWIKNNPERYEKVTEMLPEFLKRRPNLAAAIEGATNRYEEAWELMDKLTAREHQSITKAAAPKKPAPGSPVGVPKSAALNQAVDVMSMDDAEFAAWRQSQRRNR